MSRQEKLQNSGSSIDATEIAKFTAMAEEWWDPRGKFRPLHRLNPIRIGYIRDTIASHFGRDISKDKPLAGLSLLDIGSGGGLLAEPMTRLGAQVTGLDASPRNVQIARLHAEQGDLKITYLPCAIEALPGTNMFDCILAMEIVEHVADLDLFLKKAADRLKPGGLMVVATLNRTMKSFAFAIVGAEYILRWLPRGTHEWGKFLRPSELAASLRKAGLEVKELRGVTYSPLRDRWDLSRDLSVNYMILAGK